MEQQRVNLLDQINRLARHRFADNQKELQQLKSDYNRILTMTNDVVSGVPTDILQIFPSEVWIQIVNDALPTRGHNAALLLLTMVSNQWMRSLTSVSTLWRRIECRGIQEDLLATIEAFIELSGGSQVELTVYIPVGLDNAAIVSILARIGPRLCKVFISLEGVHDTLDNLMLSRKQASSVLRILLTTHRCNQSLIEIHFDYLGFIDTSDPVIATLIRNGSLPGSLRAIYGWIFAWKDFLMAEDFLERVECIESYDPIELVITRRIQLPKLRKINIGASMIRPVKFQAKDEEGFPPLPNLTALTYKSAFRTALMRLLLSVAPQLSYLELRVPFGQINLLSTALQAATRLNTLLLQLRDQRTDESTSTVHEFLDVPPNASISTFRNLTLHILSDNDAPKGGAPKGGAVSRDRLSRTLIEMFSVLYRKAETVEFAVRHQYPESTKGFLDYVTRLPRLNKLYWTTPLGSYPFTVQSPMEIKTLDVLNTNNTELLRCLRAPNIISLACRWPRHGELQSAQYGGLRDLYLVCEGKGFLVGEIPVDSFPSLRRLTLHFRGVLTGGSPTPFTFAPFQSLASITIMTDGCSPYGTMLCFALLHEPERCPSLRMITFRQHPPDWDALFLMLEMRNFIANSAVSRISAITLPFIPKELCAPLASLLGGQYAPRPSNQELLVGRALKYILDHQILGCLTCLLSIKGGCTEPVMRTEYRRSSATQLRNHDAMRIRFSGNPDPAYVDFPVLEWIETRRSLLDQFLSNLETWEKLYYRVTTCERRLNVMEITEYGARAADSLGAHVDPVYNGPTYPF